MPGSVDDVDLHAVITDAGGLRENRDSTLALQIARIEHPLHHLLVGSENPALAEHRIDQRGLSVIDVGDDRYVADRVIGHNKPS